MTLGAQWGAGLGALVRRVAAMAGRSGKPPWIDQLRTEFSSISEISAETEALFLEFGELVHELSTSTDRIVKRSGELIRKALGQDEGAAMLSEAAAFIRSELEAEEDGRGKTSLLTAKLIACAGQMRELRGVEARLAGAMSLLQIVQIRFRIETAALGEQVRDMFNALSVEIIGLETMVREAFSQKFQTLEKTREVLIRVAGEVDERTRARSARAVRTAETIQTWLAATDKQIAANQSRETGLIEMNRDTSRQVERLVIGLQVHDIMAQKLSHVREAFQHVASAPEEGKAAGDAGRLAAWHQLCKIEAEQVKTIAHDLRKMLLSLREALPAIQKQVGSLDQECVLMHEFCDATNNTAEMVQVLLDATSEIRELVIAAAEDAAESRRKIEPVAQAASGLNETMADVAQRVRLVALNAQVQAVQRGAGTGLEVLASEVADISREIQETGNQVSSYAGQIQEQITHAVLGFGEMEADVTGARADHERQAGEQEAKLHGMRDAMLTMLQEIGDLAESIGECATRMLEKTALLEKPISQFESAHQALSEAAAGTEAYGRQAEDDPGLGEHMKQRYTMLSEHQAHMAATGGETADAAPSHAGEVELF